MHAWMANFLGDSTAKYAGRLTLNPLAHLDLWYTVIIPLMLLFFFNGFIGMAKPVPYNPYNLRNQRYGTMLVGIAGPATNLFLAALFGLILRFKGLIFPAEILDQSYFVIMSLVFSLIVYINIFLGLFNLLPIHPLDGSKFFLGFLPRPFQQMMAVNPFMGVFLAIFVAILILPTVANFIYWFIVGQKFLF